MTDPMPRGRFAHPPGTAPPFERATMHGDQAFAVHRGEDHAAGYRVRRRFRPGHTGTAYSTIAGIAIGLGETVQRITIVGNGGAGKTMLANKLGRLLGIAVTHLDALRYAEDWTPVPEQVFVARQQEVMAVGRWIIDGNSLASLAGRVTAADTVIVVDPAPLVCLWGILQRRLRYRGGRHPDGVHDHITLNFLRYVCRYRRDHLPRVLACISEHTCGAEVVHVTSRRQAEQYLAVLAERIGGSR